MKHRWFMTAALLTLISVAAHADDDKEKKAELYARLAAGHWRSKDGKTFYVAIGVVLDAAGEPVREKAPE